MDTLFVILYIFLLRFLFFFVSKKLQGVIETYFLVAFLIVSAFLVPLPLILINKEVINDGVINILLAGFSLFYFGFVLSRMLKVLKRK